MIEVSYAELGVEGSVCDPGFQRSLSEVRAGV